MVAVGCACSGPLAAALTGVGRAAAPHATTPTPPEDTVSNLVDHARRELTLRGEDPWIIDGLCKVVAAFAEMGHSGSSAAISADYLNELLRFRPLMPLTDDPAEWYDHGPQGADGTSLWQNTRDSRAMSRDGGKTYTLVDEEPVTSDSGKPVHTSQHKAG
jgi:hypothetical protein